MSDTISRQDVINAVGTYKVALAECVKDNRVRIFLSFFGCD